MLIGRNYETGLYYIHSSETRKSGFVLARVFKYNEPCLGSHLSQ